MRFDVAAHQRHMATRVQRNKLKHTLTAQLRKGQAHCPKTFHPNRSQDCIPGGSVRSAGGAAQLEIGRDCLCGQRAHPSRRQDRASFGEVRPRPGAGALQIVFPCCLAQVPFRLVRLPRHNLSRYRFAQPRRCCFARHVDRGNGIQNGFMAPLSFHLDLRTAHAKVVLCGVLGSRIFIVSCNCSSVCGKLVLKGWPASSMLRTNEWATCITGPAPCDLIYKSAATYQVCDFGPTRSG